MKKQISALIAAVLLLSLAVSGCSGDKDTDNSSQSSAQSSVQSAPEETDYSDDTQKRVIFSANGTKFYTPANAIIQMTGTSTFHLLDIKNLEDTQPIVVSPDLRGLVQQGTLLYGTQKGETGIFSWDIRDISYTQRKTLFNSTDLRNAALSAKGVNGDDIKWFDCLRESTNGGDGYIYSILGYDDAANSLDGRLIRYSTDGKELEFIGSEKLASVTVYDNAIYYSSADENKKGLYRMAADGSGAQPVAGAEGLGGIRELNIVDGSLYFIAEGDDKVSALYTMKPDASECSRISDNSCIGYYIDTRSGTLYYIGGENEDPTVYSRALADGTEKPLFETRLCTAEIDSAVDRMTADGEYIYFSSSGFNLPVFIDAEDAGKDKTGIIYHKVVSGMRYDLTAGAMDYIYCHYTGSTDKTTGEKLTAGPVLIEYVSDKGSLKDSVSGLFIY